MSCNDTTIEVNTPAPLTEGVPSSVPCTTPCTPEPSSCSTTVCVPQGVPMSSCSPCGPQPYYASASMCPENNKQVVTILKRSSVLKTLCSSAMPACGAAIRIVFDNVSDVPTGAWIWAQGIGFLQVLSFNVITGEIEVTNPCPDGCDQAAAGTPIPACTLFVVSAPQCIPSASGSGLDCVRLAADMVSPAVAACTEIAVTDVEGLVVGKNVAITSGTYRLDAIISPTLIRVCNDGAGLPQGTIINAEDGNGNLIVCVILIDSNPCTFPTELEGQPLACCNGITSPLVGTENGQILVYDSTSEKSSFRTLGIPVLDCTSLTVCLTLDPANPPATDYLAQVSDTSAFFVGQLVTILGRTFEVTLIIDGTNMRVLPLPDPVVIENYPVGSQLCSADCCTQLQSEIDDLNVEVAGIGSAVNGTAQSSSPGADITAGATNVVGTTTPTFGLMNSSTTRTLLYMVVANFTAQVIVDVTGVWRYSGEMQIDGGGWTLFGLSQWGTYPGVTGTNWAFSASAIGSVPTTSTINIEFRDRIETIVGAGGPSTWVASNIGANAFGSTNF